MSEPTEWPLRFDKITARINKLSYGLDSNFVEPIE